MSRRKCCLMWIFIEFITFLKKLMYLCRHIGVTSRGVIICSNLFKFHHNMIQSILDAFIWTNNVQYETEWNRTNVNHLQVISQIIVHYTGMCQVTTWESTVWVIIWTNISKYAFSHSDSPGIFVQIQQYSILI